MVYLPTLTSVRKYTIHGSYGMYRLRYLSPSVLASNLSALEICVFGAPRIGVCLRKHSPRCDWNIYRSMNGLSLSRWWWFQIFLFSSLFGEDSHFDYYFSDGLKTPTR